MGGGNHRVSVAALLVLFGSALPLCADIHYVWTNSPSPAAPYTSWSTAAHAIQEAVDVAPAGATVVVTNGTYSTLGQPGGGQGITNRVAVTNNIMLRSVNGPEYTIITGRADSIDTNGPGAMRCLYIEDSAVHGFTLTDGHTFRSNSDWHNYNGGGVYAVRSVISNCVISGNTAASRGGGIYADDSVLLSCLVSSNYSQYDGGGVYEGVLSNCVVSMNRAGYEGGGAMNAYLYGCLIVSNYARRGGGLAGRGSAEGCVIRQNEASDYGGGIAGDWGTASARGCLIVANHAGYEGGGVSDGSYYNCTLIDNSSGGMAGGAYGGYFYNSIIWGNSGAGSSNAYAQASCIEPSQLFYWGSGNISNNPKFLSYGHIGTNSPCFAAGSPDYAEGTDIDGDVWRNSPSIGCDEPLGPYMGSIGIAITSAPVVAVVGYPASVSAQSWGEVSGIRWEFGDGSHVSNTLMTSHVWSETGAKTVVVSIYNDDYPAGKLATSTVYVTEGIHYVDQSNANPESPYTNWATAANVIQDAVEAAELDGSRVIVADGVYDSGGSSLEGAVSTSRVASVYDISLESVNGSASTFIVGRSDQNGACGDSAVRCVYLNKGSVSGFTLTNGHTMVGFANAAFNSGGGAHLGENATMRDCVLVGNESHQGGGGLYGGSIFDSSLIDNETAVAGGGANSATLSNCVLSGNSAATGGGADDSVLNNCVVEGNRASAHGGGICSRLYDRGTTRNCLVISNSAATGGGVYGGEVLGCRIIENSASENGGGLYRSYARNSYISDNVAGGDGGGIDYGTIWNCTVVFNSAGIDGGGTTRTAAYSSIIRFNRLVGFSSEDNHAGSHMERCFTVPVIAWGAGSEEDPMLVGSHRIHQASPCIGAGTNRYSSGEDLDGEPWRDPPSVGCDEPREVSSSVSSVAVRLDDTLVMLGRDTRAVAKVDGSPNSLEWHVAGHGVVSNVSYVCRSWNSTGRYDIVLNALDESGMVLMSSTSTVHVVAPETLATYAWASSPSPEYPYDTWDRAANVIQDAVDAQQVHGGLVLVRDGTYNQNVQSIQGRPDGARLVITKDVVVQSESGPQTTSIMGQSGVRCVYMSRGVLSGFKLTGGIADSEGNAQYRCGGGAYMDGGLLTNCIVSGNSAAWEGGGVYGGSADSSVINDNHAMDGGGAARSILKHCELYENSADDDGGGTYFGTNISCTLRNNTSVDDGAGACASALDMCRVYDNVSGDDGGGTSGGQLLNSLIYHNRAREHGGGCDYGVIYNCTIVDNRCSERGGGVRRGTVYNSIVYYNNGGRGDNIHRSVYHSICTRGIDDNGSVDEAPLFVDRASRDYRLQGTSPCIDSGMDLAGVRTDINGFLRPFDGDADGVGEYDIGAYEFPSTDQNPVPAVGVSLVGRIVNFQWASTNASQYRLWINLDGANVYSIWTETNRWVVPVALESGLYEWWVRPWASGDWAGPWSEGYWFEIGPRVPDKVKLYEPKGRVPTNAPIFEWKWETHSAEYMLWLNRSGEAYTNMILSHTDVSVESGRVFYLYPEQLPWGSYTWWVRGQNNDGAAEWSKPKSFTNGWTIGLSPEPVVDATRTPLFGWDKVDGATWYHLYIKLDEDIYFDDKVEGVTNWVSAEAMAVGDYTWWVRAWNLDDGYGPWSEVSHFTIPGVTHYVSPVGDNDSPYGSWQSAALAIQDAVDVAEDGDTVLVWPGTYRLGGKNLHGSNRVAITKRLRLRSLLGPTETFIEGEGPSGPGATRCVYMSAGYLDGFTLTNGHTVVGTDSSDLQSRGGAVLLGQYAVVSNCFIVGNEAGYGGAVAGDGESLNERVVSCRMVRNQASREGAAAYMTTLRDCIVEGNGGTGACDETLSSCLAYNMLVVSNLSASASGCSFYNSTIGHNAGALKTCLLVNSISYHNSGVEGPSGLQLTSSCVENPGSTVPSGCTTKPPRFIGYGDYRLKRTSPCIDVGTDLSHLVKRDLAGQDRPIDGNSDEEARYDMGCFEYNANTHDSDRDRLNDAYELSLELDTDVADSDNDGLLDGDEVEIGTDPTDADSYLGVESLFELNGYLYIKWKTAFSKGYRIQSTPDLASGIWSETLTNMWWPGGVVTWEEWEAPEGTEVRHLGSAEQNRGTFYRVIFDPRPMPDPDWD